jgi:Na+-transporting methylmalonyl-CoA/oxaloacetate decarboxylase gamma subunit
MTEELLLGLRISVIGLSITFLAMGLVILIMVLLLRIFPGKGESNRDDGAPAAQADTDAAPVVGDEQALEEMAVALAVGICLLERQGELAYRDPSLGKLLEE